MPALIETPEQELQLRIGQLVWENTALRHEIERLARLLDEITKKQEPHNGN
jgi:regulator of replication initiation timing